MPLATYQTYQCAELAPRPPDDLRSKREALVNFFGKANTLPLCKGSPLRPDSVPVAGQSYGVCAFVGDSPIAMGQMDIRTTRDALEFEISTCDHERPLTKLEKYSIQHILLAAWQLVKFENSRLKAVQPDQLIGNIYARHNGLVPSIRQYLLTLGFVALDDVSPLHINIAALSSELSNLGWNPLLASYTDNGWPCNKRAKLPSQWRSPNHAQTAPVQAPRLGGHALLPTDAKGVQQALTKPHTGDLYGRQPTPVAGKQASPAVEIPAHWPELVSKNPLASLSTKPPVVTGADVWKQGAKPKESPQTGPPPIDGKFKYDGKKGGWPSGAKD